LAGNRDSKDGMKL